MHMSLSFQYKFSLFLVFVVVLFCLNVDFHQLKRESHLSWSVPTTGRTRLIRKMFIRFSSIFELLRDAIYFCLKSTVKFKFYLI